MLFYTTPFSDLNMLLNLLSHELVYMHRQVACSYSMKSRSVICHGKVHFVEDMEEHAQKIGAWGIGAMARNA